MTAVLGAATYRTWGSASCELAATSAGIFGNVARGVELEDGPVHAVHVDVEPLGNGRFGFHVTITEGRNREVRRLCEAVGLDVERLVRTRFGPIELGRLKPGEHRALKREERAAIKNLLRGER